MSLVLQRDLLAPPDRLLTLLEVGACSCSCACDISEALLGSCAAAAAPEHGCAAKSVTQYPCTPASKPNAQLDCICKACNCCIPTPVYLCLQLPAAARCRAGLHSQECGSRCHLCHSRGRRRRRGGSCCFGGLQQHRRPAGWHRAAAGGAGERWLGRPAEGGCAHLPVAASMAPGVGGCNVAVWVQRRHAAAGNPQRQASPASWSVPPVPTAAAAAARLTLQVAAAALLAARLVQAPGGPRVKLDWVVEVRGNLSGCGQTALRLPWAVGIPCCAQDAGLCEVGWHLGADASPRFGTAIGTVLLPDKEGPRAGPRVAGRAAAELIARHGFTSNPTRSLFTGEGAPAGAGAAGHAAAGCTRAAHAPGSQLYLWLCGACAGGRNRKGIP